MMALTEDTQKSCCRNRLLFLLRFEELFINEYEGFRSGFDTPAFSNFIKALAALENEDAAEFAGLKYSFEKQSDIEAIVKSIVDGLKKSRINEP